MRNTRYLPILGKRAIYRLDKLYSNINNRSNPSDVGHCVLNTQTLLYNYFRAYYISCILGTHDVNKRNWYSHNVKVITGRDAIDLYMRIIRPRAYSANWTGREEPAWHKPDVLLDALQKLGNPAYNHVDSAFSSGYTVFQNIIPVRNYFAHRNTDTQSEVAHVSTSYTIASSTHPNSLLTTLIPSSNNLVIEDWYYEILDTIEYMCL